PAWNHSLSMEQQDDWPAHAKFMTAVHAEGLVLLGGPLEGTSDVLLIFRASDANEIHARLSGTSAATLDPPRVPDRHSGICNTCNTFCSGRRLAALGTLPTHRATTSKMFRATRTIADGLFHNFPE